MLRVKISDGLADIPAFRSLMVGGHGAVARVPISVSMISSV
jgi:hypothetical protein